MGFGWSFCRTLQSLYQIKLKGAHATMWKDTCSGLLPFPVSTSSRPIYISDFPLHYLCQKGYLSVWVLSWNVPFQPAENSSHWEHCGSKRWQKQNSLCTAGFCVDSAGLFPGLPLPLKKCHQIFPLFWLHPCLDKTTHTPVVPIYLLHWETRVTSTESDTWL